MMNQLDNLRFPVEMLIVKNKNIALVQVERPIFFPKSYSVTNYEL